MRPLLLALPIALLAACSGGAGPQIPPPTIPQTQLTGTPEALSNQGSATFEFSADVAGATFVCQLDGSAEQACRSPATFTVTDGDHTFQVTAVSSAGKDASPETFAWTVDTQPPDTNLTSAPTGTVRTNAPSFSFTSSDAGATFLCSLDGATASPCTSPQTAVVGEGSHTFTVAAVDAAGNVDSTPDSAGWTVDMQPPDTTITSGPGGTVHSGSTSFTFTSSEPGSTFQCSLDGGALVACPSSDSFDVDTGPHQLWVAAVDAAGNVDPSPARWTWTYGTRIRVMSGNLTSGNYQSYDDQSSQAPGCVKTSGYGTGEGQRIFQGLQPDIVAIQELRYMGCDYTDSEANVRGFIDSAFGAAFNYYREPYTAAGDLPNGIVSRYPILAAGSWADAVQTQPNRGFAWAQLDIPGPTDLYVISVHLLTSSPDDRDSELNEILGQIGSQFPTGAWVVLGGDFNTHDRAETGIVDISSEFVTGAPWPSDQNGLATTNSVRSYPDDWVLASADFDALERPLVIGSSLYTDGLVFDSRVYTPLAEVSPVLATDSGGTSMQHMGVVRDFYVP